MIINIYFFTKIIFSFRFTIWIDKKTVLFNLWCHWILGLKNFLLKKISKKYLILLFFVILLINTFYHTRLIDLNLSFWSTTLPSCLCQFTALTSSRKNPTTRWKPKPTQRLNLPEKITDKGDPVEGADNTDSSPQHSRDSSPSRNQGFSVCGYSLVMAKFREYRTPQLHIFFK